MKESLYLFLGKVENHLNEDSEDENSVIYCLEGLNDNYDTEIEKGCFQYFLLVLIKSGKNVEDATKLVINNWDEMANSSIHLQLLTDEIVRMRKYIRKIFEEAETDTPFFKLPFVGFDKNSIAGQKEARKLVTESCLKNKWQIWL